MELGRAVLLAVATLVIGVGIGAAAGYHVARMERLEVERELGKVRGWLEDEIRQADAARQERADRPVEPELGKARADLRQVQGELARSRATVNRLQALLREAQADWRAELQRRRLLQERLEGLEHDPKPRAAPSP
jgi:hypothetical protein